MPFPRASQALSRFTVLDLTRVRSGPTCVRQLADWGANVIKIDALMEDAAGEQPGGPRQGSDFQNLHRNKRAMTLNLKDPKGLEVFRRLAEKADVVVENFRPDVKTKLGIDYESMRKINPRIVYGSISGFGQSGPYRDRPGFDQIAQGMGGLMSITGLPGQGPVRVGIPVADLTAGLFAALGIMVALLVINVELGLVVLATLPVMLIATLIFRAKSSRAYTEAREKVSIVNADLQENVAGMRVTQAYRREAHNRDRFSQRSDDYRVSRTRAQLYIASYFPFVQLLSNIAAALIEAVNKHNDRNPDNRIIYLNCGAVAPELTNEQCSFWHFRFDLHAAMTFAIGQFTFAQTVAYTDYREPTVGTKVIIPGAR